jgi:hypothetical protein
MTCISAMRSFPGDECAIAKRPAGTYIRRVRDLACLVTAREGLLHNTPNPDL